MTTRPFEATSRSRARTNRTRRAADAISTSTPPTIHRLSSCFEQLVHRCARGAERALRDLDRTRARPPIDTRSSSRTRGLSCFGAFRSIDRKLELRAYFDHGPATERLTVRVFHGLPRESFGGVVAERGLGPVPRFDARRRTRVRARALVPASKDSTGQRSGPAKYEYCGRTASRNHRRLPHAASLERRKRRALLVHSFVG
jgi:hypothetical protein